MSAKSWRIRCPHCRHEGSVDENTLGLQHLLAANWVTLHRPPNARQILEDYSIACPACQKLISFEPRSEYRRRKALAVARRTGDLYRELESRTGDERAILTVAAQCGLLIAQVLDTDMPLDIVYEHEDRMLDTLAEDIRARGMDPKRHRAWRWLQETFALAVSNIGERDDLPEAEPDEAVEKREVYLRSLEALHNEREERQPASTPAAARPLPPATRGGATKGGQRWQFELAHHNNVESVAISADGRLGLSTGWNSFVKLWDLESGRSLAKLEATDKFLTSVCFLGDGSRVAAAGNEGTLWIWDLRSGQVLHRLRKHTFTIHTLAASADGRLVLTGSGDGTARLWDTLTGGHLRKFGGFFGGTLDGPVTAVALSPDGKWALTGGGNQADTVKIWDAAGGDQMNTTIYPERAIKGAAFMASGWQAIMQSGYKLHIMDVTEGKELGLIAASNDDSYDCFHLAHGGRWLAGGANSEVLVIEVHAEPEQRIRRRFSGHQSNRSVSAVAITPDGRRAISGGNDCSVIVWDTGV